MLAISEALSYKTFCEVVHGDKSLLLECAASWLNRSMSNWFLPKCFKLPVSIIFWILSGCLVNVL